MERRAADADDWLRVLVDYARADLSELWAPTTDDVGKRDPSGYQRFTVIQTDHSATDVEIASTNDWQVALDWIVAARFARWLRENLTPAEFDLVRERNRDDADVARGMCCHSHDFCDANMGMLDAFKATYGRELDAGEEADAERMNRAWSLAAARWLTAPPEPPPQRRKVRRPNWRAVMLRVVDLSDTPEEWVAAAGEVFDCNADDEGVAASIRRVAEGAAQRAMVGGGAAPLFVVTRA